MLGINTNALIYCKDLIQTSQQIKIIKAYFKDTNQKNKIYLCKYGIHLFYIVIIILNHEKIKKILFYLSLFLILISCSNNENTDQNSFVKPIIEFLNCPTNVHIEDTLILNYEINAGSGSIQEVV